MSLSGEAPVGRARDIAFVGLPSRVVRGAVAAPGARTAALTSSAEKFPRSYWDSDKRSYLLVIEFFSGNAWKGIRVTDPPDRDAAMREIDALRDFIPEREKRRDEILTQADGVYSYYFSRLMMSEKSHPRTFEMMNAAIVVGRGLIMYQKNIFNRPRPAQLAPDLEPMIATPGHPSYPAGHPFQTRLMSLALAELRPDARESLLALADRIGENREVAGVHYRSDTVAGKDLADKTYPVLKQGPLFGELFEAARLEWA